MTNNVSDLVRSVARKAIYPDGRDPTHRTYTVREAVEETGRSRHAIYRLIRQGEIKASMAPGGRPLWLIPGEELLKQSGPAEAPSDRC